MYTSAHLQVQVLRFSQSSTQPNLTNLRGYFIEDLDGKTPGEYMLTYTATDISGNSSSVTRKVIVVGDETPPVITPVGEATITLKVGDDYDVNLVLQLTMM